MGLQSMMFNGVSGLNRMSDNMSVLSDNIANLNTISFKQALNNYQDAVPSTVVGLGEIGHGAKEYSLNKFFEQGSLESTSQSTDMAISGEGFFMLRPAEESTAELYSRDGQFRAAEVAGGSTTALNLVNPAGYFVQGTNLGSTTTPSGTIEDILISKTSLPKATENVTVVMNLENDPATLETTDTPLFSSWDGTSLTDGLPTPLAEGAFNYQNTIQIYDSNAASNPYDLTIYFDNTTVGNEKEFLVTCNPTQDRRIIDTSGNRYNDAAVPTNKGAGALLYGKLSFNPNGELNDISCWDVPPDGNVIPTEANRIQLGRGEGYYSFDFNFSDTGPNLSSILSFGTTPSPQLITSSRGAMAKVDGAAVPLTSKNTTWNDIYDTEGNNALAGEVLTFSGSDGDGNPVTMSYTVDLTKTVGDLLDELESQFNCSAAISKGKLQLEDQTIGASQLAITAVTYQDSAGNSPTDNPALAQLFGTDGSLFETTPSTPNNPAPLNTTNYATASKTIFQEQDGYGEGYLMDILVSTDGVVSGVYSNDETVAQAQLALANFTNANGLVSAEGNAYRASEAAGTITIGTPGEGALGMIAGNSLESSNVNLAEQFVQLITTQRAFQANSVSIKTADEIYQKTLAMI